MELQTGVAQVRMERISNLYKVNLLDCVSDESQVRRNSSDMSLCHADGIYIFCIKH